MSSFKGGEKFDSSMRLQLYCFNNLKTIGKHLITFKLKIPDSSSGGGANFNLIVYLVRVNRNVIILCYFKYYSFLFLFLF